MVKIQFGFKEPDFVSKNEIKQYSKKDCLSPKLKRLHWVMKYKARRFGTTEFIVRNLSDDDIGVLERKGFYVRMRNKTLMNGKTKLVRDQWIVTV